MSRKSKIIIGGRYKQRDGWLKVIHYSNHLNVYVRFDLTGYETISVSSSIISGNVKDRLFPRFFGVGYIGDGIHKATIKGKDTRPYKVWRSMLERCYSKKPEKRFSSYKNCTVDKAWFNFQTFADWYKKSYPCDGGDYHLDKDLYSTDKKIYSEKTCCWLKPSVNIAISSSKEYRLSNPDGKLLLIKNLAKFSRDNGLNLDGLRDVCRGRRKNYKGWTYAGPT